MSGDIPDLPDEKGRARQITEVAVEAGVAAIPFAGGSLAVILAHAFSHAYEKRLREWMQQVADVVQELHDRVESEPDDLAEDDGFLDAVATATRIAEKTSAKAKRVALQNALFNIRAGTDLVEDKRAVYLRYVDELTPSHLRLLRFLDDPRGFLEAAGGRWSEAVDGPLSMTADEALPDLRGDGWFFRTLLGDLERLGLIPNVDLRANRPRRELEGPHTSAKGREFMGFVSGPFDIAR